MHDFQAPSGIQEFIIEISKWLLDNDTAELPTAINYSLHTFIPYINVQRMALLRIDKNNLFEAAFTAIKDSHQAYAVTIPEAGVASSYLDLIAKGEIVKVTRANLHQVIPDVDDHIMRKSSIIAHIAIPIKVRGKIWGSINASRFTGPTNWDESTILQMQSIGGILAATYERYSYWQTLQDKNIQLEQLSRALIRNQEVERKLLSRELHDNFSQKMALLSMEAANISCNTADKALQESLYKLQSQVQHIATEMQALSRSLHPSILDDLGLIPAMLAECRRVADVTQLEIQNMFSPIPVLSRELSLNLYRILQESLNNVTKHAKASAVFVSLELLDGCLHLQIMDDGIGSDLHHSKEQTSIGLRSIFERTEQFNGQVEFESPPTGGFSVSIKINNIQRYYE